MDDWIIEETQTNASRDSGTWVTWYQIFSTHSFQYSTDPLIHHSIRNR